MASAECEWTVGKVPSTKVLNSRNALFAVAGFPRDESLLSIRK